MRTPCRAAAALLLCSALSSAASAAPASDAGSPLPTAVPIPPPRPAETPAPAQAAVQPLAHREAPRHLAHRRTTKVHVASLDAQVSARPARLVDMPSQREGVVVHPDTVQVAKPRPQNSACDSLLCSSYIILGAGF